MCGSYLQELAGWCLELLQIYSTWQQSESARSAAAPQQGDAAAAAAEAERAGQLKALLKLLLHLTQSFDTDATSRLAEARFLMS